MTTFLFANMTVSGIKVMTSEAIDRRERFILAVSAGFGLGTILVPEWMGNFVDCSGIESPGVEGLCVAARITLTTAYAVGCIVGLILNALLPADHEDEVVMEGDDTAKTQLIKDADPTEPRPADLSNEDSEESA
jgi:NCS2 family nucleobase:cation symporter-2